MINKLHGPMMQCGHYSDSITGDGRHCCSRCYKKTSNFAIISTVQPHLENRKAQCECNLVTESSYGLSFFEFKPDSEKDSFHCGCESVN